jgi:hypothetical protein
MILLIFWAARLYTTALLMFWLWLGASAAAHMRIAGNRSWLYVAYLILLFEVIRHRNAVAWTCDLHNWFSVIFTVIVIIPPFCFNNQSLE